MVTGESYKNLTFWVVQVGDMNCKGWIGWDIWTYTE